MKRLIVILLIAILFPVAIHAQNHSYNMKAAYSAMENYDYASSIDYLYRELHDNPKNAEAYEILTLNYLYTYDYNKALETNGLALKLYKKKQKRDRAYSWRIRSKIFLYLQDTLRAKNALIESCTIDPKYENAYEDLADLLYWCNDYEGSNKMWTCANMLEPNKARPYVGIARNLIATGDYQTAITSCDYAIQLESDYSSPYSFRAEAEMELHQYKEAVADIVKALEIDHDSKAYRLMLTMLNQDKESASLIISRLKVQKNKYPSKSEWPYYLGVVYEFLDDYEKAISAYNQAIDVENLPFIHSDIADCYEEIGLFDLAYEAVNRAIAASTDDASYLNQRARIAYALGMTDEVIADMTESIIAHPEYAYYYYRRAWYYDLFGETDKALEDYDIALSITEDAYTYMLRGRLKKRTEQTAEGERDLRKAISIEEDEASSGESTLADQSASMYAYAYLKDSKEALKRLDALLEEQDNSHGYYEAACVHSVLGNTQESLQYFERTLEAGGRNFTHYELDNDLDNIRNLPKFRELINKYTDILAAEAQKYAKVGEYEMVTSVIPFTRERGGTCKVQCSINNLPLFFIFDTGASDITISSTEANFMYKNGYLKKTDIMGTERYLIANGEIAEGTVINLKNVKFGDIELKNIKASVVKNQTAPLLLGQSVFEKLGTIEINNAQNSITVTYRKKIK